MSGSVNSRLPDFIVIGAMKAGTTSLYAYLRRHPEISACSEKEPGYFTEKGWARGLEWYQGLFPDDANLKFEASTNYTKYPQFEHVPERMHGILPDVRLVYVIRNPLDRLISQLHHLIVKRELRMPVEYNTRVFWQSTGTMILNVSKYYLQYQQYLKHYDPSHIHIIRFEDFVANPPDQLNSVLNFLGMQPFFDHKSEYGVHNEITTRARVRFRRLHAKLQGIAIRRNMPSLYRFLESPVPRPVLTPDIRGWIWEQIANDLEQFQAATGRDFRYEAPI